MCCLYALSSLSVRYRTDMCGKRTEWPRCLWAGAGKIFRYHGNFHTESHSSADHSLVAVGCLANASRSYVPLDWRHSVRFAPPQSEEALNHSHSFLDMLQHCVRSNEFSDCINVMNLAVNSACFQSPMHTFLLSAEVNHWSEFRVLMPKPCIIYFNP
jgi:hypothetical protein